MEKLISNQPIPTSLRQKMAVHLEGMGGFPLVTFWKESLLVTSKDGGINWYIYIYVLGSINSHYFHVIGDKVINPIP